jgi:hypothetical protein
MNMETAKLTKQGKPIEGDPEPGQYYRIDVPEGTDIKAAAVELKKKFPKSFFAFRTSRPSLSSVQTPDPNTKPAPNKSGSRDLDSKDAK